MEFPRLPRFTRAPDVPPLQLSERDQDIIQSVHRHRFLRSTQIVALVGASSQQVIRRLKLLYHHGYLERPRAQLDYYHRGGSHPMVYGLGNKSREFLRQEFGELVPHLNWSDKNQSIGRIFLEHALLVSDVMVAIELACRANGRVRLVTAQDLRAESKDKLISASFYWHVNLQGGHTLGVIPDKVFALERTFIGPSSRAFFFLEADRGTMPVIRRDLSQTSFYRKLLAYEATWRQSVHITRFGFHRFRVLTVTTSAERVQSLVDACSQLKGGHGLFLFGDLTSLQELGVFAPVWITGRAESGSLLD
jgi:hypothetical protein